jgi:hypothetical protein
MTRRRSRTRIILAAAAAVSLVIPPTTAGGQGTVAGLAAEEAAKKVAEAFPLLRGLVVAVDGDRLLVDLGAKRGAYEGLELEVYREGGEITHPATGESLGKREVHLATIRLIDVKEEFSEAAVGNREPDATLSWGDAVRVGRGRINLALPLIDPGDVRDADAHAITKNLAISLTKTGRFMVLEDHLVRGAFPAGASARRLTTPAVLRALGEKLRAQALIVGRLRSAARALFLDLQVLSTATGATVGLASVPLTPN